MLGIITSILGELVRAKRPVLIFGYGIKLAKAEREARDLAKLLDIPVCPTWGAVDVFPDCVGAFGTHGVKAANLTVQNSDYILCIGSRLDTKATGSPASDFAPLAKLVMVDIDQAELDKMTKIGRTLYRSIRCDAWEFLNTLLPWAREYASLNETNDSDAGYVSPWLAQIEQWRRRHVPTGPCYDLVRELATYLNKNDVIVSDTGNVLGWMMQGYPFKGERFIHAFNQTPMGYGLPAAIGAAFATGERVVLVTGDGGLAVNITELATLGRHKLQIKIVLFNNRGHSMCRVTQRQWLGGTYPATSYEGGLACPDYSAVAKAYGLQLHKSMASLFSDGNAGFLELEIAQDEGLAHQIRYGEALAA